MVREGAADFGEWVGWCWRPWSGADNGQGICLLTSGYLDYMPIG